MRPASDPIDTMRPYPRSTIGSSTARTQLMKPHVSIAISRSHSARGLSVKSRSTVHPAQLTSTSMRPIELRVNCTVEETDSQSVTSVRRATTVPCGASDCTFFACMSSTSAITTRAPSAAKPRAMARPRLEAPPVTMTTRPSSPRSIAAEFWRKRMWRAARPPSGALLLGRLARAVAVQRPHERGRQALQRAASGHQDLGHHVELALRQGSGDRHRSRWRRAEAPPLGLVPLGPGQAERFDSGRVAKAYRPAPRTFRLAGDPDERRLALSLSLTGVGARPVDVDRHLRFGQLRLHVGRATCLLQVDTYGLGVLLLLECRLLLVGDLAARQHADELLRESHVLDVDAARLHLVGGQVARDRVERRCLNLVARLDEAHRLERLQRIAEVVSDRCLKDLVDQVLHRTHHRDHLRRLGVGHVDLDLQVDLEDEPFAALALDRAQLRVQVVGDRVRLGPVEGEDERRHLLGRVDPRVQRVLARAKSLAPDAAVARLHDRAELDLRAGRIQRGKTNVGLDPRHLALVDDQHRRQLDPDEEGVEEVGAVQQWVVLQADAPAVVQERLEVLVVVVQLVLLAQQGFDQLRVGDVRLRLQRRDVAEAADAARDVGGPKRLAFERRDYPNEVLGAVRSDHFDAQLVGLQPERLRRQRSAGEYLRGDWPAVSL